MQANAPTATVECMARFNSGVASYIVGTATVKNSFPVDFKGNADISCSQCNFFRDASRRCGITGLVSEYPSRYVGSLCPLEMESENGNQQESVD